MRPPSSFASALPCAAALCPAGGFAAREGAAGLLGLEGADPALFAGFFTPAGGGGGGVLDVGEEAAGAAGEMGGKEGVEGGAGEEAEERTLLAGGGLFLAKGWMGLEMGCTGVEGRVTGTGSITKSSEKLKEII